MKKLITLVAAAALASIVFAGAKATGGSCGADKSCDVKKAAACEVKEAASCATKDAACDKTAKKTADCAGGTCPLPK